MVKFFNNIRKYSRIMKVSYFDNNKLSVSKNILVNKNNFREKISNLFPGVHFINCMSRLNKDRYGIFCVEKKDGYNIFHRQHDITNMYLPDSELKTNDKLIATINYQNK